ncbi:MAG: histidine phosphatase family protein [Pseudolabrys sp.]
MTRPILYYLRHGETDWNVEARLQGRQDIPLNARGREQAKHCGEVLRDLLARDGVDPAGLDYVSSPLGRARETMQLARTTMGLDPDGFQVLPELTEISFGTWERSTIAEMRARDPEGVAAREHDKWHFLPPGGESYEAVSARMHAWYAGLTRDTVATAHGGTARGLMAALGVAKPAAAPLIDIEQGVIYVFEGENLTRYA